MSTDDDCAVLLGAVFGDGYIQKRGKQSYKVVVTSGNQYPAWFERIDRLFESVFGQPPHLYEKGPVVGESEATKSARKAGYRFYEKYLTIGEPVLMEKFSILSKYQAGHGFGSPDPRFVQVPAWVDADPNAVRSFLVGLSDTDGWFTYTEDKRSPGKRWSRFGIAQRDEGLIRWANRALVLQELDTSVFWSADAGTWVLQVNEQAHVKRLGEWLASSAKYATLLASGDGPRVRPLNRKTGKPLGEYEPKFWPNIPMERQLLWRELRETGMSLDKIAAAFGVSKNTVWMPTRGIVPPSRISPSDADRILKNYAEQIRKTKGLGT